MHPVAMFSNASWIVEAIHQNEKGSRSSGTGEVGLQPTNACSHWTASARMHCVISKPEYLRRKTRTNR